jgi:hypothetical protein
LATGQDEGRVEKDEIEGLLRTKVPDIAAPHFTGTRRDLEAFEHSLEILAQNLRHSPVPLDKHSGPSPAAQSLQAIGTCAGKKIEEALVPNPCP